jgi:hypothetical protein
MARNYKKKNTSRLIILWDTETENGFSGSSVASQWCYIYNNDVDNTPKINEGYFCIEETFDDVKTLWELLDKPQITLYAHNSAYDLMRTKAQLPGSDFKAQLIAGAFVAGKLVYKDLTIECRDSMRLLPQSLSSLSKSLAPELPKLQMDHYKGYMIGDDNDREYALRDVTTLRAILLRFANLTEIPVSKLKFSAAGQAFHLAKTIYENEYGEYKALSREWNETFLKYYYVGGRVYIRHNHNPLELFDTVSLDITSSYPYQMLKQLFPNPGIAPKVLKVKPKGKGRYFVKAKVYNYKERLPVLPYRTFDVTGTKETTTFPNGTFTTYITDDEYEFVKKHQPSTDIEPLEFIFWPAKDCSEWLKPYIQKYYALKALGDEMNAKEPGSGDALRTVAKLFLNSVYGKFAQKYIDDGGETVSWGKGEQLEVFGESKRDHRNAHISAFITGGARVHLYKAINYYGYDNVVYCDTDSVKILKAIYDSMPKLSTENDELGGWKNEGIYTDLQIIAPKVYIGNHNGKLEIKAKGMPVKNITAISINGKISKLPRGTKAKDEQSDKKVAAMITDAARELADVKVTYEPKPHKLKSFVKTGNFADVSCKTMSHPSRTKGMYFNGNVYKIIEVYND